MPEFMINWDGYLRDKAVYIPPEDISTISGWGTPLGTVYAILAKAVCDGYTLSPDYRRRSDSVDYEGETGIWSGVVRSAPVSIRNMEMTDSAALSRKKSKRTAERLMGFGIPAAQQFQWVPVGQARAMDYFEQAQQAGQQAAQLLGIVDEN